MAIRNGIRERAREGRVTGYLWGNVGCMKMKQNKDTTWMWNEEKEKGEENI